MVDAAPLARIAQVLSLDRKTVRRYVEAGRSWGCASARHRRTSSSLGLQAAIQAMPGRPHGEAWALCEAQRGFIEQQLGDGLKLTKCGGCSRAAASTCPIATLHRFAVRSSASAVRRATMPVADGEPGQELQLDTGWMTLLEPDVFGKRRRFRAWIFTPSARATASSIPSSRRRRRARSRRARRRGSFSAASSRPHPRQHQGDREEGGPAQAAASTRPSSSTRRRAASTSTRARRAIRRTRPESSAACRRSATTASRANG